MSRMLPIECEHGVTVEWGDFGPCQNCDEHPGEPCPNQQWCWQCDEAKERAERLGAAATAVIEAAIRWRTVVVLASPPNFPPPRASTALAAAVDAYRKLEVQAT